VQQYEQWRFGAFRGFHYKKSFDALILMLYEVLGIFFLLE
jgi:hypothetical protein